MSESQFTAEQLKCLVKLSEKGPALLEMQENYERASWLGRFVWKTILAIGATVAGVAAFKEHIVSLFSRGG